MLIATMQNSSINSYDEAHARNFLLIELILCLSLFIFFYSPFRFYLIMSIFVICFFFSSVIIKLNIFSPIHVYNIDYYAFKRPNIAQYIRFLANSITVVFKFSAELSKSAKSCPQYNYAFCLFIFFLLSQSTRGKSILMFFLSILPNVIN